MPHTHGNRRTRRAAAALLILLAALGLAACGGSSNGSSGTTSASATTTNGKRGQFAARASALRACLQKEGITLPKRAAGQAPRGPFGYGSGGPELLKGVTRAKFQAALKKCGGRVFAGRGRFDSAQGRQRFAKFAECMRKNGVNLPAPNTSGNGPIFNTKAINTNSTAFKTADAKCMKELRPRGGAAGPGEGAPAPGGEPGAGPGAPGAAPEGPPPGA